MIREASMSVGLGHGARRAARILLLVAVAGLAAIGEARAQESGAEASGAAWAIAIHGGAGTARRETMDAERERAYREKLTEALLAGKEILQSGGSSLDAVEAAIRILEDSPLFNAGKGAVFTHDGKNELDSSIMDGSTLEAGAVAGVHHVKNPISLARRVMEASPHVLFAGQGAEEFALEQGIELVPKSYFWTENAWRSLQTRLEAEQRADASDADAGYFGTVGAVALDTNGNLAAGTSTGGMTNKRFGRIGDSPIIGAGTYADNRGCAVSATGHGEYFIRNAVAYDICARARYLGSSIDEAADAVVMGVLVEQEAEGGVIALDPAGNAAMPFNTSAMLRGYLQAGGEPEVAIFKD
jgi:beta-aspartyl-peptidase (threonine type)